ncbi:GNAT family N-acetyltransferase [Thermomonospora cellulosilytica]|uniref:GNAT superfamily N-acetyltransferase n=1 Tax=Thermomonospora cellulosilytica TaxID=1411118 RepID=A0A7W3MW58_9ACTN|nr:GNAT family N-acetyltransferase [Thermomonospora cellulosilytica]MBA9002929.1 GNAT superfamily N-acetyltransferase [Thermomonospora cellulosilytica]
MAEVRIAECREEDVDLLERHMPSPGRSAFHARRHERQRRGLSTYLVAWLDGVPVGHGEIRWNGCDAPEVRARHPGCPEINALAVWPPELRSRGIGTTLIRAAEQRARQRGHAAIGLGVEDGNHAAARLYLRLGYQDHDCPYLNRYDHLDRHGVRHEVVEHCRFLVKPLP